METQTIDRLETIDHLQTIDRLETIQIGHGRLSADLYDVLMSNMPDMQTYRSFALSHRIAGRTSMRQSVKDAAFDRFCHHVVEDWGTTGYRSRKTGKMFGEWRTRRGYIWTTAMYVDGHRHGRTTSGHLADYHLTDYVWGKRHGLTIELTHPHKVSVSTFDNDAMMDYVEYVGNAMTYYGYYTPSGVIAYRWVNGRIIYMCHNVTIWRHNAVDIIEERHQNGHLLVCQWNADGDFVRLTIDGRREVSDPAEADRILMGQN